jgi:hypothetical protein
MRGAPLMAPYTRMRIRLPQRDMRVAKIIIPIITKRDGATHNAMQRICGGRDVFRRLTYRHLPDLLGAKP